jgi:hypothetical protein
MPVVMQECTVTEPPLILEKADQQLQHFVKTREADVV